MTLTDPYFTLGREGDFFFIFISESARAPRDSRGKIISSKTFPADLPTTSFQLQFLILAPDLSRDAMRAHQAARCQNSLNPSRQTFFRRETYLV